MFLPPQKKQWQCVFFNRLDRNLPSSSVAFVYSKIINHLINFSSGSLVVDYSCNGTTAGVPGDGINRINGESDVVMSSEGNPHSWIVFKQPALSNNFQIMFDFLSTRLNVRLTWDQPFLGGSNINSPQSTTKQDTILWDGNYREESQSYYIMQSTDGEHLRICSHGAGRDFTTQNQLFVEKIEDHGDLHTNPFMFRVGARDYIPDISGNIKEVNFGYDVLGSGGEHSCTSNFWGNEHKYTYKKPLIVDSSSHVIGSLSDFGIGRAESFAKVKTYQDDSGGYWLQLGDFLYPWNINVTYL